MQGVQDSIDQWQHRPAPLLVHSGLCKDVIWRKHYYPYDTNVSSISCLLRQYIDTPTDHMLSFAFADRWQILDILLAAYRR